MDFLKFALKRVAYSVAVIYAVVVLNFILMHLAPGDVIDAIVGEMGGGSEELIEKMRVDYGLDKGLPAQLYIYLRKMTRGDLGISSYYRMPITDLILPRVPPTILLLSCSLVLAVSVGTFLGVLSARKPNSVLSYSVNVLSLIGYAAPVFWIGIMLLILFGRLIPILPISGMYDIARSGGGLSRLIDIGRHLVLPTLTLSILYLAIYSRLSQTSMREVLGADYIRTARAKGLPERVVIYKHALRNAVLPVITMTGFQMGQLFAGAVVTETVFNWPGMGRLTFDSILRRDTPTLMGILVFSTGMVVVANLVTDLLYGLIDPRIKR